MQLTITVLGYTQSNFISRILASVNDCNCSILEMRANRLIACTAAYLLVNGEWNQIAKLESLLESLEKKLEIKIHRLRPGKFISKDEFTPFSMEIVSLESQDALLGVVAFIGRHNITIEEVSSSRYQDSYSQSELVTSRFILLVPLEIRILNLREEFLEFCDQINIDAILEPIKR
jgi:glycine cleavage system transcriptional repressor